MKKNKHLATSGLQGAYLVLAFVLGDRVLDFFAEGGKETTASPSGAKSKQFTCFCWETHKSRVLPGHLGDILLGQT